MLRRRGIQTQIVSIVILALILLAVALQAVQSVRQHNALVRSTRTQSLAMAVSLRETFTSVDFLVSYLTEQLAQQTPFQESQFRPALLQRLNESFTRYSLQNSNVDFAAVILPDGTVLLHSRAPFRDKQARDIGLANLPDDETVRRDLPEYGDVYLTRTRIEAFGLIALAGYQGGNAFHKDGLKIGRECQIIRWSQGSLTKFGK